MLSEELRRERESRGVSLERMARETRISIAFLRAVEAGDLQALPGEFYRKAFLRTYARYLGLAEDRVLGAYDYYRAAPEPARGVSPQARTVTVETGRARAALALPLPLVLLLIVGVVAGAGSLRTERSAGANPLSSGGGEPQLSTPTAFELELPFVPEECEKAVPTRGEEAAGRGLHLVVEVAESCWLEVRTDGVLVSTGTLVKGQSEEYRAQREVRLSLGNAGGVSLRINGRPGKTLGKSGQALKNLRITPDNFRDFLAS
jgi:cytoskeletal protein RodZ